MKLSIVVPVYYNEMNLPDTIPRLLSLRDKIPCELELIFVDDGSRDHSLETLLKYQSMYPKTIVVVKLSRNFGSWAAIQAGLTRTTGECVGLISADGQDPPELFVEMVKNWQKGIKAVFAVRMERDDPKLTKLFASIYYSIFRRFAIPDYPKGGFDYFLVDRQIINDINRIHEKNTHIATLIFWLGYRFVTIPYKRLKREKGKSKWTLGKKIKLAIDTFVGFSYFPIRLLSGIGLILALSAFTYGAIVFYNWWIGNIDVPGWTALMIMLAFTSGIQMMMLGLLGEYLWRTFDESRRRPIYVIDKVFDSRSEENQTEKP